jgi:hypothetical protein
MNFKRRVLDNKVRSHAVQHNAIHTILTAGGAIPGGPAPAMQLTSYMPVLYKKLAADDLVWIAVYCTVLYCTLFIPYTTAVYLQQEVLSQVADCLLPHWR